jgi:hypothetical protein
VTDTHTTTTLQRKIEPEPAGPQTPPVSDTLEDPLAVQQLTDPLTVASEAGAPASGGGGSPVQMSDDGPADASPAAATAETGGGTSSESDQGSTDPPNLTAGSVGALFADLMPRLARSGDDENANIIALYTEVSGRMRAKIRSELTICESGISSSYEAMARGNLFTSGAETRLRLQALTDLKELRRELSIMVDSMNTFMISRGSSTPATFARGATPTLFADVYNKRYRSLIITKAAQQIIDQKARIGQFGLGQQKIVEDAAKEVADLSKRMARMVFVKGMGLKTKGKVSEETWGLVFDTCWGALEAFCKQVFDSWLDGQDFDEDAFCDQMLTTVLMALQKYLLEILKGRVTEGTGGFRKFFTELGIDIGGDLMQQLEGAMANGADAGQAFQQVFSGDNMQKFFLDFGTDKLLEAVIGAGTGNL